MVIVAMLSLGLTPVAQAQEKKDNKLLALGVIGGLVFVVTTVIGTHNNRKEIVKLRYEAMADRRTLGEGLVKTNARLNAVIASMEKRQKALQGEQGTGPTASIDSPAQQSTRYVEVQNDSTEEVFLRNIISSGPEGASEEKLEWPIPAKSSTRIILSRRIPLEKLFAVDRSDQVLTIDIVKSDEDAIIITTPNG
jgi:hypothetical protein